MSSVRPTRSDRWVLRAYVDSDWGGDKIGRKSTSSAHLCLNGVLVHSHSRTQATVATSSAEAEVYAMGSGACEGLMVRSFMEELML